MVSVDLSVFVQIVNFILLIWLMNIVLYKPIRGVLARRKQKVEGLELGIRSSTENAREKEEAFNTGIREARVKGVSLKDSLVEDASSEEKRIISELQEKAKNDLAEVREKISRDVAAARKELQKEIDVFAVTIGEKILGRAV
jgi:F-type H+-transporting ATPase subunit b